MIFHPLKRMAWAVVMVLVVSLVRNVSGQTPLPTKGILFQVEFNPYTNVAPAEVIPHACGRLWLDGTNLSYRFATSRMTNVIELRGPAINSSLGPILHVIALGTEIFNARNVCNAAADIPPGPDPYPPPPPNPPYPLPPRPPYFSTFLITTGSVSVAPEQIADLVAGRWSATTVATVRGPHIVREVIFGGQILILDSDGDGIPDYLDQCPDTIAGSLVNSNGCSIADLCPCEGPWKNHGQFEHCVKEAAKDFERAGLITKQQRHEIEKAAKESDCGKKEKPAKPPKGD